MTSMLLTASSTSSSDMASAPCLASHHLLAFTRHNALFLRIIKGRVLVHFGQHCPIRLNPIGDEFPVLPVPLLDAHLAVAFVVITRQCNRHHQPVGAQLCDALRSDVEMFVAPLNLFALERLLAEFGLGGADRLKIVDCVDSATVVEYLADLLSRRVTAIRVIDIFEDVLDHGIVLPGAMKG